MTPEAPPNPNTLTPAALDPARLREIRQARGLSQAAAGLSVFKGNKYPSQQWNSYEKPRDGSPKRARYWVAAGMAAVLGVNISDLLVGCTGGVQVIAAPPPPAGVTYTEDDLQTAYRMGVEDGRAEKGQVLDVTV